MSKKPIKSSLFRFVTLRSPQAIDDKESKIGLIIPDSNAKGNSAYYQAVDGITDNALRKDALRNESFTAMTSKVDIKNLKPSLYDFASWLSRNKDYLTYASIASNTPENFLTDNSVANATYLSNMLSATSDPQKEESIVWDNLIHQTINRSSLSVRETLIQMLIANKFLKAFKAYHDAMDAAVGEGEIVFTDQDEKEFSKRANASVVIEKEVLLANTPVDNSGSQSLPPQNAAFLRNEVALSMAENNLRALRKAQLELEREEKVYKAENEVKYQADYQSHLDDIKLLVDEPTNYTIQSVTDPETQIASDVQVYTGPDFPKFDYTPLNIDFINPTESFSRSDESEKFLSTDSVSALKSAEFKGYKDFSSLKIALEESIKKEESKILKAQSDLKPKKVLVNGTEVTLSRENVNFVPYDFTGCIDKRQTITNIPGAILYELNLVMKIFTGLNNTNITSMIAKIVAPDLSEVVATHTQTFKEDDSVLVTFSLPDNSYTYDPTALWNFQGTFVFENSETVDFNAVIDQVEPQLYGTKYCFDGRGVVTAGGSSEPVAAPTLKGVSNLGIADYLRVEQEICCYVPGEVSHIENIMAREYKEKATRSFVSSEITTEQTRETEVENLTDTTSTERNELSTEVSSVIDEQNSTNFGANASVSGKSKLLGVSYTAGTSFGSSSSTSTSDSNSQAQNFAQEVTERALERVVNKVSSKRTSRVLREFEENNKHGFDNTKGENHVTGVYRWVDKVYKNQIVNYGKRLMYEFSIPEPSHFLKTALFEEEEADSSTLITPKKPKELNQIRVDLTDSSKGTVENATDIGKDNYQRIAAAYNAEVTPYPRSYAIGKSYVTNLIDRDKDRFTAIQDEIDIPEGYVAYAATSLGQMMWHLDNPESPKIVATVGDITVDHECKIKGHFLDLNIDRNVKKAHVNSFTDPTLGKEYYQSVPVAAMFYDVEKDANITFSIDIKPSTEAIEQWQNETYNAIIAAYYDRMNEYNDFMRAEAELDQASGEDNAPKFNPEINRAMERRELKRCAIELLTNGTDIKLAKNRYVTNSDNLPMINANDQLDIDVATIKFFEQAFDWEIMSYNLYPYYYNSPSAWKELIKNNQAGPDPIFQAFLQSGMARVVVPVRPGFETAVNWYEATGEIWEGQGMVTDINDDLYLSVAEELTDPVGVEVGAPWETKVPTSLTIVQAKSAFLPDGGLPCDPNCSTTSQFGETSLVISGGSESNAADGVGADIVGTDNDVA